MSLICSDIESMLWSSWTFYCKLEVLTHFYWQQTQYFWEQKCFHHLVFMLYINVQKISTCFLQFSRHLWWSETWMFHCNFWQVWWKWLWVLAIIRHTWETEWMNQKTYKKSIVFKKFWNWIFYEKISWIFFLFFLK